MPHQNQPLPTILRRAVGSLAMAALALLASACLPIQMSFYHPGAAEGAVTRNVCPPVDNLIIFEKRQVTIKVTAYVAHQAAIGTLTFLVPEGRRVQLLDQQVEVSTEAAGVVTGALQPGSAWMPGAFQPTRITADQPLPGRSKSGRPSWLPFSRTPGQPRHINYNFGFTTPLGTDTDPKAFILQVPSFRVDGTAITLPPIEFTRDRKLVISGLNC